MKQKARLIKILSASVTALGLAFQSGPAFAAKQASTQPTQTSIQNNLITKDIQIIVNFLSAGVGILVVMMIIIGGIQYAIAGDNPQKLTAAKHRIINALIALVAFVLMFSFLQWLIPGGVFG